MAKRAPLNRRLAAMLFLCLYDIPLQNMPLVAAFHESSNTLISKRTRPQKSHKSVSAPIISPSSQPQSTASSFWMERFHSSHPSMTSQAGSFLEDFDVTLALATSLGDTFWKPLQDTVLRILDPLADLGNQPFAAANLVSIPFWAKLTTSLQRFGENTFLALLCIALIQGGIAVFQYRNNPSGELMVPPGLTVGEELPADLGTEKSKEGFLLPSDRVISLRSGDQNNLQDPELGEGAPSIQPKNKKETGLQSLLRRASRSAVILLPWLTAKVSFIFQRNSHLFHIGSILTLTSVFDVPQSLFQSAKTRSNATNLIHGSISVEDLSLGKGDQENVVVIGDSLAVGLGTIDQYDRNKTSDIPFRLIENIGNPALYQGEQGPAFPQAFAKALAQRLQKRVTWRSAGVDGGDVPLIQKYCLSIIKEEVQQGRVPDVVVILCGANDMKYFLSNPFQRSNWPRAFRSKLTNLIADIRDLAPNTTVVLPAFPTQMFHKNSPLNVFPLGFLLDSMVGFFDSQKKFVADCFPSEGVLYLGLSPREVGRWYSDETQEAESEDEFNVESTINDLLEDIESFDKERQNSHHDNSGVTLIAADGVHPNARCYTRWASAISNKLIETLQLSAREAVV